MDSYVYVVGSDEFKKVVKIGKANCIHTRISELNRETANPFILKLLFFRKFETEAEAFTFEKEVHRLLNEHCFNKEFFYFNEAVEEFISENFYPGSNIYRISLIEKDRRHFFQSVDSKFSAKYLSIMGLGFNVITPKYQKIFLKLFIDSVFSFYIAKRMNYTKLEWAMDSVDAISASLNMLELLEAVIKDKDYYDCKIVDFSDTVIIESNFHEFVSLKKNKKFLEYKCEPGKFFNVLKYDRFKKARNFLHEIVEDYFEKDFRSNHPFYKCLLEKENLQKLISDLITEEGENIKDALILDRRSNYQNLQPYTGQVLIETVK